MSSGIIGKKLGMTQLFDAEGRVTPVTVIEAGPCTVVQRKTLRTDGYEAVQLGFGRRKAQRANRPDMGHAKRAGQGVFAELREFRVGGETDLEVGQEVRVDMFREGDIVDVTGRSRGRGFTGVVGRWGFRGGRATHGSMFHRAPGSIGASSWPSRVIKNMKMGGQYGNERVTVQNLKVVAIRPEKNLLLVRGAVPGARNSVVLVRRAAKKSN